jgi:hypothetical protein
MPEKTRLRLFAKRALICLAFGLAVSYACDFVYFRIRMSHPQPSNPNPLETFTAPRLYAIGVKGGKIEYEIDQQNPQQTWTCAHSLFPQAGYSPCWYIKPRSRQPIPM